MKVLVEAVIVPVKVVRVLVEPIRGTVEAMKKDFVKQNNRGGQRYFFGGCAFARMLPFF